MQVKLNKFKMTFGNQHDLVGQSAAEARHNGRVYNRMYSIMNIQSSSASDLYWWLQFGKEKVQYVYMPILKHKHGHHHQQLKYYMYKWSYTWSVWAYWEWWYTVFYVEYYKKISGINAFLCSFKFICSMYTGAGYHHCCTWSG